MKNIAISLKGFKVQLKYMLFHTIMMKNIVISLKGFKVQLFVTD